MKTFIAVIAVVFSSGVANAIEKFSCVGTEPFWALELVDGKATYTELMGEPVVYKASYGAPEGVKMEYVMTVTGKAGRSVLTAFVANGFGYFIADKDGKGPDNAQALRAYCSDGMSDRLYPYIVNLTIGKRALTGCCSSASRPALEPK